MSASGNKSLAEVDPEVFDLIEHEKHRQWSGLELIASENFTSRAVLECLGSVFTNKYAEGLPGKRYYGGNEFVDAVENLCRERALAAFHLDPAVWGVNVQPYSGSTANFAAYTALLHPHDRLMGLDLPCGGHLTHGYYTDKKKISAVSVYFESLPYRTCAETGLIDYNALEAQAEIYRPKLIISGASAYPREWDYARLRKIADQVGAVLMSDIAHISGLVASQVVADPFEFCDIVTTTTHKSLRGPRAGMIFFRKRKVTGEPTDFEERINFAVFPMTQGGPHINAIAAIATQLREVATPEFREYAAQIIANCRAMAQVFIDRGYKIMTGGTDNHLILWDVRPMDLTGNKVEKVLELAAITVNKNTVAGDKSALAPGGVRIGTPALTSRGLNEADFAKVADFLIRGAELARDIQNRVGKKLDDFVAAARVDAGVQALRVEVEAFARTFPMPGFDVETMRYKA